MHCHSLTLSLPLKKCVFFPSFYNNISFYQKFSVFFASDLSAHFQPTVQFGVESPDVFFFFWWGGE